MRHSLPTFLLALIILSSWAAAAAPVEINNAPALMPGAVSDIDVSVRLIGGKGAVLMPGRDINLTFQTSADAYVIIYNIDSEGYVHLLYPSDGRPDLVRGKKVYFLPEQGMGTTWEVSGETGIEYIHAVAVADPSRIDRDELYYLAQNSTMPEDRRLRIDMDPFLAFNMIDEELVEDAERAAPATDYTYFYVNRQVDYPGYLCYKCHSPSKVPDPYAMECPEVDIEMIGLSEDESYPYPQLFAVLQAGETAPEEDYESYEYYADNLSLGYEDYEYDESKVYLSVYYTGSYYPYNYYWPGYWPSYSYWNPGFYWGFSWGWGWNWGGGYYRHHYPFSSWYGYYNYPWYCGGYYGCWGGYYGNSYWAGYDHGWYDGYWYGSGGYYDGRYVNNRGSIYARREFTKRRSLDYTATRVKTSRDAALASSRLVKERTKRAADTSYRKSRLAKQVTRERASTGFRSFETNRYNTGRAGRDRRNIYGNYGSARSARIANEVNRMTRTRTRSDRRGSGSESTPKSDRYNRNFERKSGTTSTRRGSTSTNRTHTGSELQRRVQERREQRESKARESGASKRRYTPPTYRKSDTRSKSSRSSKSSKSSARSKRNDSGKPSTTTKRQSSPSRSSTRKSSTRSTPRSSGSRSSSTKSSGSRSSGSRSSGKRSTGRKR